MKNVNFFMIVLPFECMLNEPLDPLQVFDNLLRSLLDAIPLGLLLHPFLLF